MAGGGGLNYITGDATGAVTAVGADAVITLPATPDKYWIIPGLIYSYDLLPTLVGGISIADDAVTYQWDEVTNGSIPRPFEPHLRCGLGQEVVITLKNAGPGITGKLNIIPGPYLQG